MWKSFTVIRQQKSLAKHLSDLNDKCVLASSCHYYTNVVFENVLISVPFVHQNAFWNRYGSLAKRMEEVYNSEKIRRYRPLTRTRKDISIPISPTPHYIGLACKMVNSLIEQQMSFSTLPSPRMSPTDMMPHKYHVYRVYMYKWTMCKKSASSCKHSKHLNNIQWEWET